MSLHWAHTGWHAVALAGKFKSGQVGTKFFIQWHGRLMIPSQPARRRGGADGKQTHMQAR